MKTRSFIFAITFFLASCVQYPTESAKVSDLRPTISFQYAELHSSARVYLDGQDVGAVNQFSAGLQALKITPGTHTLEVRLADKSLLNERFYVADGVHKNFIVR